MKCPIDVKILPNVFIMKNIADAQIQNMKKYLTANIPQL